MFIGGGRGMALGPYICSKWEIWKNEIHVFFVMRQAPHVRITWVCCSQKTNQLFSICKWIYNGKNVTLNLWICHMLVGRWKAWHPYRVFKLNMTYFKGQYSQLKLTSKLWNHYERNILRIEETKICILSIQLTPAANVRSN